MSARWIVLLLIAWCSCLTGSTGYAQIPAARGIVWNAPTDPALARADLSRMRDLGVTAVRTGLIEDERILRSAAAFEIALYQEVASGYLTTGQLRDTLEATRRQLTRALAVAHRYPSARHFGIARYVDTTDEETCDLLRSLAGEARSAAPPGSRVYYVALFIEEDRCSSEVDFVLLNARDDERPADLIRRWSAVHEVPVGLAAVGTWHAPRSPRGLRSPRSFESQARFLETALGQVRDSGVPIEAIFAYRWRDVDVPLPAFHGADRDPYRATYGLVEDDGSLRPVAEVLGGVYRGDQHAFAFPTGEPSYRDWPWPLLAMWLVVFVLALLYALSPRFRHTVPRYFAAHGFYRDSVREGRNLLWVSSLTMLVAVAISSGVALVVVIDILGHDMGFRILVSWLPQNLVQLLGRASATPLEFILIVAAIYAGIEVFWILALTAISHIRSGLALGQVMLFTIWPRWPLIVFTIVIVAVGEGALSGYPLVPTLVLTALWIVATLWSIARAVVDYTLVTRMPAVIAILAMLLHPFVVLVAAGIILALGNQERLEFVARVAGLG